MRPETESWRRAAIAFGFTSLILIVLPLPVGALGSKLTPGFLVDFAAFAAGNLLTVQAAWFVCAYLGLKGSARERWRLPISAALLAGILAVLGLVAGATSAFPPSVNLVIFAGGIVVTLPAAKFADLQIRRFQDRLPWRLKRDLDREFARQAKKH